MPSEVPKLSAPRHLLHVAKQQAIFGDDDESIQKTWIQLHHFWFSDLRIQLPLPRRWSCRWLRWLRCLSILGLAGRNDLSHGPLPRWNTLQMLHKWAILNYLELSWAILSYLELSWNDEPNIPNQTIKQNRLWCRNLFAIYLRATSCLQSMEELHRPRHVQVGLGWSSGAAREPNNGNWSLLGTRLPFISPPNWRCFVAGCCNQLPSYERCSQLPILDVDWIYTVDVDICWWSFWIVLLHTIFHRDQKVTGALPKMAISCTTPTDLLYLLDSNIM